MQATLSHYNTAAFFRTFTASCYVAGKLVYGEIKPIALELWSLYTSEQAKRIYAFLILSAIALVWMTAFAAVWLGNRSRDQFDQFIGWRDRFIASHLEQPSEFLTAEELAEEGRAELVVSDAIAQQGVSALEQLFDQADAIMSNPIYADAPATIKRCHRKSKALQPQEVIA